MDEKPYRVTQRVVDLVIALKKAGYRGTASISSSAASGAAEVLQGSFHVALSGFCKETLHIAESAAGEIVFVGRYSLERSDTEATVDDIVSHAWSMYRAYKDRGYSMPDEFRDLFEAKGYIQKRTRTVEEWVET